MFRIDKQTVKTFNNPHSNGFPIRSVDYSLLFNWHVNNYDFTLPRETNLLPTLNGVRGLDLGIDWERSSITLNNKLIPREFYDNIYSWLDTWDIYRSKSSLLPRYELVNHKNDKWGININSDWRINSIQTIPWVNAGKIESGNSFDNLVKAQRSRYCILGNTLIRCYRDIDGLIKISSSNGSTQWGSIINIGEGSRPTVCADTNNIHVAYERYDKIYYRIVNPSGYISDEILINRIDENLPMVNPPYVSGYTYKEPLLISKGDDVILFYAKGLDEEFHISYVLAVQSFRIEHNINTISGDKSNLFGYISDDKRLLIGWVNTHINSDNTKTSNIYYSYTNKLKNDGSYSDNYNTESNPGEGVRLNIRDSASITLINQINGEIIII